MRKLFLVALFGCVALAAISLQAHGDQNRADADVEEFVSYYCGEDTVGAFREQHPDRLFAPRNAESDPYLACRKAAVLAKLKLDTNMASLRSQNTVLSAALREICQNSSDEAVRRRCRLVRKTLALLR